MTSIDARLAGALRTAADAASARTAAPPAPRIAALGRRRRRVRVGATVTVTACLAIAVGVTLTPGRPSRTVGPADAPSLTTPTPSAVPGPSASATLGPSGPQGPSASLTTPPPPPVPSNTPAQP
ncbi:hypothetical protein ACFYS8_25760 [Kitasatospora sp. NPDC004615]|uniref:hypothetical protein n=1 Tax=Kitasatospora sp. NPDC004615 TaxID=3364017 RepID=UPI00367E9A09